MNRGGKKCTYPVTVIYNFHLLPKILADSPHIPQTVTGKYTVFIDHRVTVVLSGFGAYEGAYSESLHTIGIVPLKLTCL